MRVPLGANNYFRLCLDKDRLIQQQKERLTGSISTIEKQQEFLTKKRADVQGLMGYVEVYLDALKRKAESEIEQQRQRIQSEANRKADSTYRSGMNRIESDTIGRYTHITDSLTQVNFNREIPIDYTINSYTESYDSIMKIYRQITELQNRIDSISGKLEANKGFLESKLGSLNTPETNVNQLKGDFNLLQTIQKLELGLTYPKSTGLSNQNVPIKGFHVELQKGPIYLSVASGLTLNNVMLSTNEIQNKLNYNHNVFNNFDFQQILNNGWLTLIKTGYGTPEGTHAFIGFNYLTNTRFTNPSGSDPTEKKYDPAAAFELDLKVVPNFLRGSSFELVYGKTSRNRQLDSLSTKGVFESVFSYYQSHVLLTRYTQQISKLRSEFTLSYRRMDPYVNTTTYGMMQPNNQRIEMLTTHRVAKFMKVGLNYRFEESLRSIAGMNTIRLHVAGGSVSGSYTQYFNYSFFVNHVNHEIGKPYTSELQRGRNYLVGLSMNGNYEVGHSKASTSLSYNDYLLTDTARVGKFTQFGFVQTFLEKRYSLSASYDYFFQHTDSLKTGMSVFGLGGKYSFKKLKIGASLKFASDFNLLTSVGGTLEATWQVHRLLDVSFKAERFVLGNFYRSFYRSNYEQFPYLFTLQTRFKI
ncbi:hypothetical protein [Fluviicola chungangensis]|uniref:Uncharacterized protein n=1 Tax=Fluviicola chungangensis TaxID=2597671 RepID=A0A556MPM9_9FLAO|nr:hypothetical protein [Fluviicola chungangensis]TSJ41866.1 hypothetical protein FO442_12295 [Fluviicola chungangensis]